LNLQNNKTVWQKRFKSGIECAGGSSATASDLVFVTDSAGHLDAYDAKTGKALWTYAHKGLSIDAPPIVYGNEGKEYVAIVATMEGKAALLDFALNATEPPRLVAPQPANAPVTGKSIFATNCGSCHTLAAAGTTGNVGPDLDQLKPSAEIVEAQVISGGGEMPAFKGQLSAAEIKAVAGFVAEAAGKETSGKKTPMKGEGG
jgi:mono/diheme cytochrome c family protein